MKDVGCFGGVWVPPDVGLIRCPQIPCWQEALGGSPRASPVLSVPFLSASWGLVTVNLLGSAREGGDACGKQVSWNAFLLLTRCGVNKETWERKGNPPIRCELGSGADEPRGNWAAHFSSWLQRVPKADRPCWHSTAGAWQSRERWDAGQRVCTRGDLRGHAGTCLCSREAPARALCLSPPPLPPARALCGTAAQRALLEFHALFVCIFSWG